MSDLLDRILALEEGAFAVLHRPHSGCADTVDVLAGDAVELASLADIPLAEDVLGPGHDVLVVVPYRQISERGFTARDDGAPLIAMAVADQQQLPLGDVLTRIPDVSTALQGGAFDCDDARYAATVRRIIAEEIGTGEGANFVIKRSFVADIGDYSPLGALALFRRLLLREQGAYWTFVIHTGERTLVGATPERHITLNGGTAVMNPISGTYRYPGTGPTLEGVSEFLSDTKEADELYMVVDEELKMMARICDSGGRVVGPFLREMASLAHTEYFIEGETSIDVRETLRETMFAPTVTGSPLESATRVIHRHEPDGRGYYSGVAALIGRDAAGARTLDSAIMIRTADIDPAGRMRLSVGATLVRHSDPEAEVEETRAKAAGMLRTFEPVKFSEHPDVQSALRRRNTGIAGFWLNGGRAASRAVPSLATRTALVIDAEDTFTAMLDHQLRSLGLTVTVRRFDEPYALDGHDLVVMGPGPGDPRALRDPKIAHLHKAVGVLLASRRPFLAVCLSHQVLSLRLGLPLLRRDVPNQGVAREIDLFGEPRRVGFYNTFCARSDAPWVGDVEVARDPATGEVHALRGPTFASMQFHPESLLTVDGPKIVGALLEGVLGR
ncbi:chorismate-binding protein [Solirubrobacter phytolaccae]|uniref:anthranilate synthase n=1 Tax=Solirubrobacter phytolaccae TaxID=1404360 RepID=A0A9X3NB55_9ACTN|nr:chorismate-binding protein [Solirubrobacter phytolaccae]MDA0181695.1 chorismate-binding protein [Solirubrobacter phytolaccae]